MKKYEIDVLNCGDDSYMLMSKGHHDIELFKSECKKEYEHIGEYLESCECPCQHLWYKAVPRDGYNSWYAPVDKSVRGAFPATVWWE